MNAISKLPKRQGGFATVLVLALVGVSITVAVLASVDMIRGTQAQTTSYHSQVQAQMNAWSGVSALYEHFKGVQQSDTPPTSTELFNSFKTAQAEGNNLFSGTPALEAYVTRLDGDGEQFDLTVSVHGISKPNSERVRAVSIVDVVSRFSKGDDDPANDNGTPPVMDFVGDLKIKGDFEVISESDAPVVISIDGFIESGNSSITGVDIINATESIDLGGASEVKVLRSNGDVRLTGSVKVLEEIGAMGNVCLSGGTESPGMTKANGYVFGEGSAEFGSIQAKGQTIDDSYIRLCDVKREKDASGNKLTVILEGNHNVDSIKSIGSVMNNGGRVGSLLAEGDLYNGYGSVDSGTVSGDVFYCDDATKLKKCEAVPSWKNNINVSKDPDLTVSISDVEEVKVERPAFDAYEFRDKANYAFETDKEGFAVVTVKNVSNIPDGDYFLGSYDGPYKDRLCTSLTSKSKPKDPECLTPAAEESFPLCEGHSEWSRCISFEPGKDKKDDKPNEWEIDGESFAQGVLWFEGELEIKNGTYFNTFIVTEDIKTDRDTTLYAPNYAGYDGNGVAPKGICTNAISPNVPTQFCEEGTYNPVWAQGIGNYALLAGSVDEDGSYQGGDIELKNQIDVFGSILAGNELDTKGDTTIRGYVAAYAAGEKIDHSIGGSTTIILDNLPPTYTPQGPLTVPETGEDNEEPFNFELLWSQNR